MYLYEVVPYDSLYAVQRDNISAPHQPVTLLKLRQFFDGHFCASFSASRPFRVMRYSSPQRTASAFDASEWKTNITRNTHVPAGPTTARNSSAIRCFLVSFIPPPPALGT